MCLILEKDQLIRHTAKENIVVYKVILLNDNLEMITPHMEFPIKLGETYSSKLDKPQNLKLKYVKFSERSIIERGLHSYINLDTATEQFTWWKTAWIGLLDVSQILIVKCIIPKRSAYYLGIRNECASSRIKYIEVIKESDKLTTKKD